MAKLTFSSEKTEAQIVFKDGSGSDFCETRESLLQAINYYYNAGKISDDEFLDLNAEASIFAEKISHLMKIRDLETELPPRMLKQIYSALRQLSDGFFEESLGDMEFKNYLIKSIDSSKKITFAKGDKPFKSLEKHGLSMFKYGLFYLNDESLEVICRTQDQALRLLRHIAKVAKDWSPSDNDRLISQIEGFFIE